MKKDITTKTDNATPDKNPPTRVFSVTKKKKLDDDHAGRLEQGVGILRINIGTLIQEYMEDNNLTITKLAEASGVSREQVGWLITGRRDPRLSTLLKVVSVMGYTLTFEKEE